MRKHRVRAEAHSDDWVVQVEFDAAPWLRKAPEQAVIDLADIDWGGDYAADAVARGSRGTAKLFNYLAKKPRMAPWQKETVGFEVHVDPDDALTFLCSARPRLGNTVAGKMGRACPVRRK